MAYIDRKKVLLGKWEDVTGDRERDGLICALRAVESREGERRGWDQPPRLWTLHFAHIDSAAVKLRPVPGRAWRRGTANPADDIRIEVRTICAVDINGHGYMLLRLRGHDPEPVLLIDPAKMHAPSDEGPGRVTRALFHLAWAARTTGWPSHA